MEMAECARLTWKNNMETLSISITIYVYGGQVWFEKKGIYNRNKVKIFAVFLNSLLKIQKNAI